MRVVAGLALVGASLGLIYLAGLLALVAFVVIAEYERGLDWIGPAAVPAGAAVVVAYVALLLCRLGLAELRRTLESRPASKDDRPAPPTGTYWR